MSGLVENGERKKSDKEEKNGKGSSNNEIGILIFIIFS